MAQKPKLKEICSVTVRGFVDSDPDTSHLGEWTDDYSLDVVDRHERCFIRDLLCQACDRTRDEHHEYTGADADDDTCTECGVPHDEHCGSWDPLLLAHSVRGYRFFRPGPNHWPHNPANWAHVTPEDRAKVVAEFGSIEEADKAYALRDYERMESLVAGSWWYICIRAEASIRVSDVPQTISSGGLCGIESDSDRSYLDEVASEELAQLRAQLRALGFSKRAVDVALAAAETSEG